jgi:putative AlgH/UPF0301 family transcriptional regulator
LNKKLTFPIIIAVINTNKVSFSGVDDESSYSSVILICHSNKNQMGFYIKSKTKKPSFQFLIEVGGCAISHFT